MLSSIEESKVTNEDIENEKQFDRSLPVRNTVARKCREFYVNRLERTELLQRRWTLCAPSVEQDDQQDNRKHSSVLSECQRATEEIDNSDLLVRVQDSESRTTENPPLRKWNSTFDLAMDSLRKEITSLIAQDNDLFRQLLSLNDTIADLKEQQRISLEENQFEDDEDDSEVSRSPSLDSLSEADTTASPASTLSSSCSSSSHCVNIFKENSLKRHLLPPSVRRRYNQQRYHKHSQEHHHINHFTMNSSSSLCLRCHSQTKGLAPPYRKRSQTLTPAHWKNEEFDSHDSGIHLQESHSDSDHEIFV